MPRCRTLEGSMSCFERNKSFSSALVCSRVKAFLCCDNGFEPFITDAVVSLVGGKERVPIKILRDTPSPPSHFDGGLYYDTGYGADICSMP